MVKEKIEQIIDRNTEGNYLLSSTNKAQMVSEIMDLVGVADSLLADFLNDFGLGVRWGFPSLKLNSSINLKFKYNV